MYIKNEEHMFNPLLPSLTYIARLDKNFDFNFRKDHQINSPTSVATMSR